MLHVTVDPRAQGGYCVSLIGYPRSPHRYAPLAPRGLGASIGSFSIAMVRQSLDAWPIGCSSSSTGDLVCTLRPGGSYARTEDSSCRYSIY